MDILIDNRDESFVLDHIKQSYIEEAIASTLSYEGLSGDYEISISLVDKDEIRELNKEYRQVDQVTDVLSFPLFDNEIDSFGLLGDIVICTDRVREQAVEYNHSEQRELMYLTVHSVLHLLGYDHIKEEDKKLMRSKEKDIMKKLQVFKG